MNEQTIQGEEGNRSLSLKKKSKRLILSQTTNEGLLVGKKQDGSNYSVRVDRRRYFFPDEWLDFIKTITNKEHRFFFITCLHTGGRIMEVLNLRYKDIDEERGTVEFVTTKQRKAKASYEASGKTRRFFVAGEFLKEYKSFTRGRIINKDSFMFLDNKKLPVGYEQLDNQQRKKYYSSGLVSYSKILQRRLKKIGIKDWYNFSPHNIRKTYGMWMRIYNMSSVELAYRMGHDTDTYMEHYGSALIFTEEERRKIQKIMGEVK